MFELLIFVCIGVIVFINALILKWFIGFFE